MLTLGKFKFIKRENERKKLSFYERMKILRHKQGLLPIKKIITKGNSCRLNLNLFEMTNAQEIIPGLFVCGEGALSTLSNNFDLVIDCMSKPTDNNIYIGNPRVIHHNYDDGNHRILTEPKTKKLLRFVHNTRMANGKVLVHCQAGISRSISICILYMMYYKLSNNVNRIDNFNQSDFDEYRTHYSEYIPIFHNALYMVRQVRKRTNPNIVYSIILKEYGKTGIPPFANE